MAGSAIRPWRMLWWNRREVVRMAMRASLFPEVDTHYVIIARLDRAIQ